MRVLGNENRLIKIWVCVLALSFAHALTLGDLFDLQFYHMKMEILFSILADSHEDLMKTAIAPNRVWS